MVTISLNFTSSLLSILGCIGNSFTMIIISKWKNISSGAAFMFSLALTDLAALSYDGIVETLLPLMGVNVVSLHGSLCPIFSFISWMTTFSSFYLTILFRHLFPSLGSLLLSPWFGTYITLPSQYHKYTMMSGGGGGGRRNFTLPWFFLFIRSIFANQHLWGKDTKFVPLLF